MTRTSWWLALPALLLANAAQADIKVGVMLSLTGPAASLGIPEKNAVELMPTEIAGQKINYIMLDDASDPTAAVSNARKLIDEEKVDFIIGPSVTPTSLPVLEVVGPAKTPSISLSGSQSVIMPPDGNRRWMFKMAPPEPIMGAHIFGHFKGKTMALVQVNTAFGGSFAAQMKKVADAHGVQITAWEKFNQNDASVTPQVLKIIASYPDAVFIAASGTPAATPVIELRQRGFKGTIYLNQGVANPSFLQVGGHYLDGALMPVSPVLVAEQLHAGNPVKKVATDFNDKYEQKFGPGTRSLFAATAWDAFLLLSRALPNALKVAKPGTAEFREAVRDSLEDVKDLVGTQGVFNMTPTDHCGADERAQVLVTINDGNWILVNE